ncbi:MAG TPA: hypothetical protein PK939_03510 [Bacteroidales bacterium]|nr:hypothetical protein [Bacteroidales bacterium]
MIVLKKQVLPVLAATIWISLSEFFRNEFLLKQHWIQHYSDMGQQFPGSPINGAVWGVWSLIMSILVLVILQKFSYFQTVFIVWIASFVMMWLVIGNLGVLPFAILPYAIPLSLLKVFVATAIVQWIIKRK